MSNPEPIAPEETVDPSASRGRPHRRRWMWIVAAILVVLLIFLAGVFPRIRRNGVITRQAQQRSSAVPVVSVVAVRRSTPESVLILPGTLTPLTEAFIYARASGYLKKYYVDIGDRVRASQLLARIEAPDLDEQVDQARATLQQSEHALALAEAQLRLAKVTWERWKVLLQRNVVSRQEADTQEASYQVSEANVHAARNVVASNQANLRRLQVLQSYENVRSPFDGIVTARNVDIGALISASGTASGQSSTPLGGTQSSFAAVNGTTVSAASPGVGPAGSEMFRVAEISRLRVLVSVPQENAPQVRVGEDAAVVVQQYPTRKFMGKVTRTSNSLDQNARTLLTEVDVDNPQRILLPGMYARVSLIQVRPSPPMLVPDSSLVTRGQGAQVAAIMPGNKIHYQVVEVGRDYGTEAEIIAGVQEGQLVAVSPNDQVTEGAVITPRVQPPQQENQPGQQQPAPQSGNGQNTGGSGQQGGMTQQESPAPGSSNQPAPSNAAPSKSEQGQTPNTAVPPKKK